MQRPIHTLWIIVMLFTFVAVSRPVRAQVEPWNCDVVPSSAATPETSLEPAAHSATPFPTDGGDLTVFAAASLTDVFTRVAGDIVAANPDVEITFNFAGSQALVTQVTEAGADADVLALASPDHMTAAVEAGAPVNTTAIFAHNRLTIVVPRDNPAGVASVNDLAVDDVRLVLANPDVPAGDYARQALCKVAGGDSDFLGGVADNVVSLEQNVRAVLTKVQLGEADAGIVYVSDAQTAVEDVVTIEIAADQNVVASYPIAALTDDPLASAFVSYVLSSEGQATLASFGFEPIT